MFSHLSTCPVVHLWEYWNKVLVTRCSSLRQGIREETLESSAEPCLPTCITANKYELLKLLSWLLLFVVSQLSCGNKSVVHRSTMTQTCHSSLLINDDQKKQRNNFFDSSKNKFSFPLAKLHFNRLPPDGSDHFYSMKEIGLGKEIGLEAYDLLVLHWWGYLQYIYALLPDSRQIREEKLAMGFRGRLWVQRGAINRSRERHEFRGRFWFQREFMGPERLWGCDGGILDVGSMSTRASGSEDGCR